MVCGACKEVKGGMAASLLMPWCRVVEFGGAVAAAPPDVVQALCVLLFPDGVGGCDFQCLEEHLENSAGILMVWA